MIADLTYRDFQIFTNVNNHFEGSAPLTSWISERRPAHRAKPQMFYYRNFPISIWTRASQSSFSGTPACPLTHS